ncbi:MAG: manganese efflux pump [Blastochloris viridis]|uniref:Putative manganese efflux pump MntP n=1 Tax=Blastochloris viridis TaxID=1079 RepID=A0A6N4RBV0_BLAVI|nr:MAG: manganese efflux pump [Blastochloris viridis]
MEALFTLVMLAIGLSVDTFAAAVSKGASLKKALKKKQKREIAIIFTACAVAAPALGYSIGFLLSELVEAFDHWIAFFLLSGVGLHMAYNGFQPQPTSSSPALNQTKVFLMAIATNIDAVAVGIGIAFTELNIVWVCIATALGTLAAVYLGITLGKRGGKLLGPKAEIIGGLILVLIGFKTLLSHLFG